MQRPMTDPLEFTGERFTPECVREIWYEHWHRYAFARSLCEGKRVLDAACGEGYGSNLLAQVAREVVAVDLSTQAIAHARQRYATEANLRFEEADATQLPALGGKFDVIVSFETLEHLHAQEELLAGFASQLADDGILLISSPDKHTYSDLAGHQNEFHVRELYRPDFEALLARHFPHRRLYGQKLLFQSTLWALDVDWQQRSEAWTADQAAASLNPGLGYAPLYFVALCSRLPLPTDLPGLSLFGDGEESVYSHYNHEIRKNMAAGARIAELEAQVARLQAGVADQISNPPPPSD